MINKIHNEDCLETMSRMDDNSIDCCITSPPYWGLRDYGVDGQLGLESTPELYVQKMVQIFAEIRRVLKKDGTLWLNLGDSYAGSTGQTGGQGLNTYQRDAGATDKRMRSSKVPGIKPKDLCGIPWRVAFALQADGWYLRSDIIWSKPNPMPESVTDRPTKAHEYLFLMSKSAKYFYNAEAIKEPAAYGAPNSPESIASPYGQGFSRRAASWKGSKFDDGKNLIVHPNVGKKRKPAGWDTGKGVHGSFHRDGRAKEVEYTEGISEFRNKRSVWTIATQPFPEAHFAVMPEKLVEPCVLAGSREGDIVLDPFCGAGTVPKVAKEFQRSYLGIELSPEYCKIAEDRLKQGVLEG